MRAHEFMRPPQCGDAAEEFLGGLSEGQPSDLFSLWCDGTTAELKFESESIGGISGIKTP